MSNQKQQKSGFEETVIAVLLGLMTMITFVNVVMRYVFNSGLIWGLEVTLILFAWLVLFGISYGVKITAHLGVDAIINLLPANARRVVAIIVGVICIAYSLLLLKGAWDYWAPYAAFDRTSGRWFPTGFEKTRDQAWYITDQVPMPEIFRFLEGWINQGETYDKLPRVIPYTILPVGVSLLLFRFIQATIRVWKGQALGMIVSHEVEDELETLKDTQAGE